MADFRVGKPLSREDEDKRPLVLVGPASQMGSRDIRPRAIRGRHIAPGTVGTIHLEDDLAASLEEGLWQTASLQNSWVDFNVTLWDVARYRTEPGGIVRIAGLVKNGTMTNGTVIFTLATGFRPAFNHTFATVQGDNTSARIAVGANGNVTIQGVTDNAFLSLACAFPLE